MNSKIHIRVLYTCESTSIFYRQRVILLYAHVDIAAVSTTIHKYIIIIIFYTFYIRRHSASLPCARLDA